MKWITALFRRERIALDLRGAPTGPLTDFPVREPRGPNDETKKLHEHYWIVDDIALIRRPDDPAGMD